jgi:hypothetical protein
MDIHQASTKSTQEEMKAKLDSHDRKLMTIMKAGKEKQEAMREACLGKKEAIDLKANPEETKFNEVYEEVLKEEATVETHGALRKWNGDQHLAIRCHGQLKKWTQGDGGSWKKLATHRGMTCWAGVAWHNGHGHQGPGKDSVVQGTQKGRTSGKGHQPKPEFNNGIRNRDLKEQLCVGSERAFSGIYRKALILEIVK